MHWALQCAVFGVWLILRIHIQLRRLILTSYLIFGFAIRSESECDELNSNLNRSEEGSKGFQIRCKICVTNANKSGIFTIKYA